jgi:hypothetical protein
MTDPSQSPDARTELFSTRGLAAGRSALLEGWSLVRKKQYAWSSE